MIAVYFDPTDADRPGRILATVRGAEATIKAAGRSYLPVTEYRDDFDVTHRVVDGRLVEIAQ